LEINPFFGPAGEAKIIGTATKILKNKQVLEEAFKAGKFFETTIGDIKIIFEPDIPNAYSAMTLYGENGFALGRNAFKSSEEFTKTILHELFRLQNGAKVSASGAAATAETHNAWSFAERIYNSIFK
jgi:hypothetical protein